MHELLTLRRPATGVTEKLVFVAVQAFYFELDVDYATRQISVRGEFDVATAGCLATAVTHFQRAARGDITIRLEGVSLMDSAGLDAIVHAVSTQMVEGRQLVVTGASVHVRQVFVRADLARLLQSEAA
jgi:anti-anti-sigma factor